MCCFFCSGKIQLGAAYMNPVFASSLPSFSYEWNGIEKKCTQAWIYAEKFNKSVFRGI